MKVLIQNYSTPFSTEPLYLMECLKSVGVDAFLWADGNLPAFDVFDTHNPDFFVGHFAFLTEDILKYLSKNANIKSVINITGTNAEQLENIKQTFLSMGVSEPTFVTGDFDNRHGDSVEKMLPCYDLFIRTAEPQFKMPTAVITNDKSDTVNNFIKDKEVYHLVSYAKNEDWSDYACDIRSFWGISNCYDEVTLVDDGLVSMSQFFFQATMLCNKFNVSCETQEQKEAFSEMLSYLFESEETSENVEAVVKKQIIKNHTCFNRASKLMSILGDEEKSKQLLEMVKNE